LKRGRRGLFTILSRHLDGGAEEDHESDQSYLQNSALNASFLLGKQFTCFFNFISSSNRLAFAVMSFLIILHGFLTSFTFKIVGSPSAPATLIFVSQNYF
jgi:hypothetical protein